MDGFNYLAQMITRVKFTDAIEAKAVEQVAAQLRCPNKNF
jgi:hypothetical protein